MDTGWTQFLVGAGALILVGAANLLKSTAKGLWNDMFSKKEPDTNKPETSINGASIQGITRSEFESYEDRMDRSVEYLHEKTDRMEEKIDKLIFTLIDQKKS